MSRSSIGRAYALARIGTGLGLALAPRTGGRVLGQPSAAHVVRLLGVRDLLLGVEALLAAPQSRTWRRAMTLCAVADAADAAMTVGRLRRREPLSLLVFASAVAGTVTGLFVASEVAEPAPASGTPGADGDAPSSFWRVLP